MRKTEIQDAKRLAIAVDAPSRLPLRERTLYEPNLPQEEFIVPLLCREIESCIANYATPARGTAMADRILSVLDSSESRVTMGAAARRNVTQRDDISQAAPRVMEIIERNLAASERAT